MKRLIMLVTILMMVNSNLLYSQGLAIGVKASPHKLSKAYVVNPSPAQISGPGRLAFEGGLVLTKSLTENFSIRGSWDWGIVDWEVRLAGSGSAFGSHNKGEIDMAFGMENYFYKAIGIAALYKVPLGKRSIELVAGSSFRRYRLEDEPLGMTVSFSTDDSPAVDLLIDALGSDIYVSLPVGVNYLFNNTRKVSFKAGIMYNIPFEPIADSRLIVNMDNQTYIGKFSPRTSFIGLNLQLDYSIAGLFGDGR